MQQSDKSQPRCELPLDNNRCQEEGSVLGLVLFLIYVNHITYGVLPSFKAFAEDYKLYLWYKRVRESAVTGVSCPQSDLERVSSVVASWNWRLDLEKCVVEIFTWVC